MLLLRLWNPSSHTRTGVVALNAANGASPSIAAQDWIERSAAELQSMAIAPQAEQHDLSLSLSSSPRIHVKSPPTTGATATTTASHRAAAAARRAAVILCGAVC